MMNNLIIFIISACVGSFVNVIALSLPKKLDFIKRRSFCPKCFNQLRWYDLIPILSYLNLKGKCRYCHCHISLRYLLIEIISGIIGLICYWNFDICLLGIYYYIYFMLLLCIALIDYDNFIIYDEFIILFFIFGLFKVYYSFDGIFIHLVGMFSVSGLLYVINFIIHDSFGGGDIKLFGAAGFILGLYDILTVFVLSVLLAGFVSLIMCLLNKTKFNSYIAFGPFICIAIFIVIIYGHNMIIVLI